MDSILLGLVLGLIHGKHHDHDDSNEEGPPAPSLGEAWRKGWAQGSERGRNNFIARWLGSLPGGRQWRAERKHHG